MVSSIPPSGSYSPDFSRIQGSLGSQGSTGSKDAHEIINKLKDLLNDLNETRNLPDGKQQMRERQRFSDEIAQFIKQINANEPEGNPAVANLEEAEAFLSNPAIPGETAFPESMKQIHDAIDSLEKNP